VLAGGQNGLGKAFGYIICGALQRLSPKCFAPTGSLDWERLLLLAYLPSGHTVRIAPLVDDLKLHQAKA
jgi:hypothetical protein